MSSRKYPKYVDIDGFRCPPCFLPKQFRSATTYKPKDDEVVVVTYPKCGTTWMVQIALLIQRNGEPPTTKEEYFASTPFLEMHGAESAEEHIKPGVIKTHLPFQRIKFSPGAKYIYVARHPRDCVVSFYHHTKFFPIYLFSDGKFDDFFDLFVAGNVDFNDYFDNLLSWYEHRHEENVFFVTYESMISDPKSAVLKLAKFLGDKYHDALIANGGHILNKVLRNSSFDFMKSTTNEFWKNSFTSNMPTVEMQEKYPVLKKLVELTLAAAQEGHFSIGDFVRKGGVGEGKIVLTPQQTEKLNARIIEKTSHSDVMSLWKNL